MTFDEKIERVQLLMGYEGEDELICAYLKMAESEILSWSGAKSVSPYTIQSRSWQLSPDTT